MIPDSVMKEYNVRVISISKNGKIRERPLPFLDDEKGEDLANDFLTELEASLTMR